MRSPRLAPALLAAALIAAAVALPAAPAAAAPPADVAELQGLMQTIPTGGTATLENDIIDPGTPFFIRDTITLDLNGFTLETNYAVIDAGKTLTVIGSGTWTAVATAGYEAGIRTHDASLIVDGPTINAHGNTWNAGIGGYGSGGSFTLKSGTVTATGGRYAAGVGGWMSYGHGGSVTVDGGTLIAYGGEFGAGIGSGMSNGNGATVIVNGGTVIATGGYAGHGIGSGQLPGDSYGSLTIAAGATVTAIQGPGAWALGGTTTVAGTLIIPTGNTLGVYTAPTTVTSTGKITGGGAVAGDYGLGGSVITNNGIITNAVDDDPASLTVLGHNYQLSFDGNFAGADPVASLRVYATTLADGARSLPIATRPGYLGLGWNTAPDGSGTTITPTTVISGDLQLYAMWSTGGYLIQPASGTVVAGTTQPFVVGEIGNFTTTDVSSDFTYSSDNVADAVTGNQVAFTIAGNRTITATKTTDSTVALDAAVTVVGDAANPADLGFTASSLTAVQGGSITLTLELFDAYGNSLPTSGIVITSDQPTDQIVGTTVTFRHASPHVLTATIGSLSDRLTIEVSPSALAATGTESTVLAGLAGLLLLGGAAGLIARRRALH